MSLLELLATNPPQREERDALPEVTRDGLKGIAAETVGQVDALMELMLKGHAMSQGLAPQDERTEFDVSLPSTEDVGGWLGADTESEDFDAGRWFALDPFGPLGKAMKFGMAAAPLVGKIIKKTPGELAHADYFRPASVPYDAKRIDDPTIFMDDVQRAKYAESRVAEESPLLKVLWGVDRGDLRDMALARPKSDLDVVSELGFTGKERGAIASKPLVNDGNAERLVRAMRAAHEHAPELTKGMTGWYVQDPIAWRLKELLGDDEWMAAYDRINSIDAAYSPQSDVLKEMHRASIDRYLTDLGRRDEWVKHGNNKTPPKGLHPLVYSGSGSMGHDVHTGMVEDYLARVIGHHPEGIKLRDEALALKDAGKKYSKTHAGRNDAGFKYEYGAYDTDAIKVPLYRLASGTPETGFTWQYPVGDAHYARATGLPDTRSLKKEREDGVSTGRMIVNRDSMTRPEGADIMPWYRDKVAGELGMQSTPTQALQWGLFGPQTGVKTALGEGKLELRSKLIGKLAEDMGISPEEARDLWLLNEAALPNL